LNPIPSQFLDKWHWKEQISAKNLCFENIFDFNCEQTEIKLKLISSAVDKIIILVAVFQNHDILFDIFFYSHKMHKFIFRLSLAHISKMSLVIFKICHCG